MQKIQGEIKQLNAKPNFPELRSVVFDADAKELTFNLQHPPPYGKVVARLTEEYMENYPIGSLSLMVGESFHVLPNGENRLPGLARHVHDLCQLALAGTPSTAGHSMFPTTDFGGEGMGEPTTSWLREGTVELAPVQGCGESETEGAGMNPQILSDITRVQGGHGVVLTDQPVIEKAIVVVTLDLKPVLNKVTCSAWNVEWDQPLEIRLIVDRGAYLDGPMKVDVGQAHHFRTGVTRGLVGQLQRVAQHFVDNCNAAAVGALSPAQQLVSAGFDEVLALKALEMTQSDATAAAHILTTSNEEEFKELGQHGLTDDFKLGTGARSVLAKRMPPPRVNGFLDQLVRYILQRIPSIPEFCVICDRPHVFAAGTMLQAAVCTRDLCLFKFQQLNVATDIVDSVAVQTAVVDLLVTCAQAAVKSSRWELIFNPFPLVFGKDSKKPALDPENKDVNLAKTVLSAIPSMRELSGVDSSADLKARLDAAHEYASATFNWIVSSNRTHLVQIPPKDHIKCMGTPLQFVMISQAPDLQAAFMEKKRQYGCKWAFHGSRAENWHSILRNGLKNASGTKLQVNGAAHGQGIYLSPSASVSWGYSQISSGNAPGNAKSELDKQYLDLSTMHCIAVAESVEHEVKKSGNIWVQKHEDNVQTRFFFVYQHGMSHGSRTELSDAATSAQFDQAAAKFGL